VLGRFSPEGSILASQEAFDGKIRFWDVRANRAIATLNDHDNPVWSPDGRYLAVFGPGRFKVANGETGGDRIATVIYEVASPQQQYPGSEAIHALAIGAGGGHVAAQGSVWEVQSDKGRRWLVPGLAPAAPKPHAQYFAGPEQLWALEVVGDGKERRTEKIVQVFPKNREIVLEGIGLKSPAIVQALAISADGKRMLLGLQRPGRDPGNPNRPEFEFGAELWDLEASKRLAIWDEWIEHPVDELWFTPDGRNAVAEGVLWDVATGKNVGNFSVVGKIAFRSDSQVAYAAAHFSADHDQLDLMYRVDAKKWDIDATWPSRQGHVESVVLGPDDTILATGGADGSICLWDPVTQRELARWEAHAAKVTALAFHPDGKTLISGAADGTLRLWDLPQIRRELKVLGLDW
jgi:WD40 repeat protein